MDNKRCQGNEDLILTVKDVSLLQLLSSGSLAKSSEGGGENYFYTL